MTAHKGISRGKVKELVREGESIKAMAEQLNVSRATIRHHLKRLNIFDRYVYYIRRKF